MEEGRSRKPGRRRKRQFPQKRSFQASYLYRGAQTSAVPLLSENRCDSLQGNWQGRMELQTPKSAGRNRDKSPLESSERRNPYIPPYREIYQSGLLGPSLRPPLRSREALLKALLPCENTDSFPRLSAQFLIAGLTAIGTERRQRSLTPLRLQQAAAQSSAVQRTRTASSTDLQNDDKGRLKYFNAEIIPKKAARTVSLQEIQRYLQYVGTKPFK